jgi:hypothetical protein
MTLAFLKHLAAGVGQDRDAIGASAYAVTGGLWRDQACARS